MKRIVFIFVVILATYFLSRPTSVFATIPTCNLSQVNVYAYPKAGAYTAMSPKCLVSADDGNNGNELPISGQIPVCSQGQSPCDADQVYCDTPFKVTLAAIGKGNAGCFEVTKDVNGNPTGTKTDLTCKTGTSGRIGITLETQAALTKCGINLDSVCCADGLCSNSSGKGLIVDCSLTGRSQDVDCGCVKSSTGVTGKNACSDPIQFKYDPSIDPNYCVATGATTPWELHNICDDSKTIGVQSAIGCIPTGDMPSFLAFILKFALGAAGGITLLMFIATGYTLITSTGNPEKLQAVKENLVSIFSGLVMIGFSLVLLQTIGGGILQLPSFAP